MKIFRFIVPVAALMLLAGPANAQNDSDKAAQAEAEKREALENRENEMQRRLADAEARMAEAARQIAELTSERLPQLREIERRIEFIGDDKPRLGVNIGEDNIEGPVEGVRVVGVTPGSAAEESGLRSGDTITAINGEPLSAENADQATRKILDFMDGVEQGDVLSVEYLRDGKVGTVEVEPRATEQRVFEFRGFPEDFSMPDIHVVPKVIGGLSNDFIVWPGNVWADMELVELNEGLGKYFGADSGVLVVSAPESSALQLEDGDVIRKIDGREPTSVRHTMRILSSYQAGEQLEIEILREKKKRTLEIEMPDDRSGMLLREAPMPVLPASMPHRVTAPAPASERT
jgi:C-terminal processing protease CtpA/Prc